MNGSGICVGEMILGGCGVFVLFFSSKNTKTYLMMYLYWTSMQRLAEINSEIRICQRQLYKLGVAERKDLLSMDDTEKEANLWITQYNEFEKKMFPSGVDVRIFRILYLPVYIKFDEQFRKSGDKLIGFLLFYEQRSAKCSEYFSYVESICTSYANNLTNAKDMYGEGRISVLADFIDPMREVVFDMPDCFHCYPLMQRGFIDAVDTNGMDIYIRTCDLWVKQYKELGYEARWASVVEKVERLKEERRPVPDELRYVWGEYTLKASGIHDIKAKQRDIARWRAMNYEEKKTYVTRRVR